MESFDDELICNILVEEEYYDGNSCDGPSSSSNSMQHHHSSFPIEFVEMGSDNGIEPHHCTDEKQEYESMTVDEIVYSHMNGMSDSSRFAGALPVPQSQEQPQQEFAPPPDDDWMEPIMVDPSSSSSKSHRRGGETSRSDGELMIDFDDSPLPFVEEVMDHQQQSQTMTMTSTPPRQLQRQQRQRQERGRPPMEKSNSWSGGCCAYSVSPSTTTTTTASTSSSYSTIGTSTNTPPIIRKSSAPGVAANVSISTFAGDALSRVSKPNPDRYMRLLSAKQKKDKILMMTRVLLGLLQKHDQNLYTQAMAAMEECSFRHKNKERGYESLTMSTQRRLRQMVGEDHWNRARMLLRVKVERENSSNGGNKNTCMSYFKRLTMTEMANLLAAYGISKSDIANMQRYDRVATLCHLSSPQQQG